MVSFDLSDVAKRHLYYGDTDELNVTTYTNDTIDLTLADWGVGASGDGSVKFQGGLAEMMFWPGVYIDLSSTSNRRLFVSAGGKWVNPASAIATLGSPIVRFHLDKGEAATGFATNRGTGGNFAITGTLTIDSTSPSD